MLTVHNLAFQGKFPRELLGALGLPKASFDVDGVEYYGEIGFLKAGLQFCDAITTVSPSYAEEIMTPAFGMGLEGLLRKRSGDVFGILNGVDTKVWDPACDERIAVRYNRPVLPLRSRNKTALQQRLRLALDSQAMLIGVVSRLTWQKGLDVLLDALSEVLRGGAQLALLGAGDAALEKGFAKAAQDFPSRVGVVVGYDESLSHQIQAGADVFLAPSRFEPCGLTQLYALRYGAVLWSRASAACATRSSTPMRWRLARALRRDCNFIR